MNTKISILVIVIGVLWTSHLKAQKTDSIYHINSNILTGDFKKMVYGVATFKMTGMGTVNVDEYVISSIKSQKLFEIKVKSGWVYYGRLDTSFHKRKLNVVRDGTRKLLDIPQIVEIYPIHNNFWKKLSGSFGMGYEYSKGSDIGKINISGVFKYRKKKTNWKLSWDNHITYEADSIKSSKANSQLSYERDLQRYWSFGSHIANSHNSELGIQQRVSLAALIYRDVLYSNIMRIYLGAGLSGGPEKKYGEETFNNVLNGLFTANWTIYKLSSPEIKLESEIAYLPYLSEESRHRFTVNVYPHIEVVNNFYVGLKYYYELDSNPDDDNNSKTDWGINLNISYSFH